MNVAIRNLGGDSLGRPDDSLRAAGDTTGVRTDSAYVWETKGDVDTLVKAIPGAVGVTVNEASSSLVTTSTFPLAAAA